MAPLTECTEDTEDTDQMSEVGFQLRFQPVGLTGQRVELPARREIRSRKMQIKSAKDLKVYNKAYSLAMEIYELSKAWPPEEKYSLTDQIRRASRSVCSNLREAGSAP